MSKSESTGKRSRARLLIVQSLYQLQIGGHDKAELLSQFHDRPEYQRVDKAYFDDVLAAICDGRASIEENIGRFADRPVAQLDPVERAILLLGFYELESRLDVPSSTLPRRLAVPEVNNMAAASCVLPAPL